MHIIVTIKQVPDTDKVRMDPDTGTMIREGVEAIVNPLDLYAIETALRLKERHGGSVTVATMGPPDAARALREALSMGCDKAVLLTDRAFSGSDTWATSYALSKAIAGMEPYDLIIAGERATDGDTGQVGPGLAAWLGIPVLSYVASLAPVNEGEIEAERLVEDGYQRVSARLPCLVTVVKEIANPRLPTLRGKKFARTAEVRTLSAADIGADLSAVGAKGSPTKVSKIFYPKVARDGVILRADDEAAAASAVDKLLAFLDERGLIAEEKGGAR